MFLFVIVISVYTPTFRAPRFINGNDLQGCLATVSDSDRLLILGDFDTTRYFFECPRKNNDHLIAQLQNLSYCYTLYRDVSNYHNVVSSTEIKYL